MNKLLRFAVFFCALALLASGVPAQNTNSGDIRGTVTDASGAVISGVTVSVLNVDTGISKDYVTNESGLYDTSSIIPGSYKITFSKDGFEKYVRGPVTVQVGLTTVDGILKVGSINEEVVVSTDVPLLQTETGEQSTTLEAQTMAKLPQVGQNWANFAILLPGTSGAPSSSQGVSNPGTGISVNGNLPYYSNFLSDGATTTLPHSANVDVSTFETVSEVQINTAAFSAQYGIGATVFNQISKTGTNSFHGSAYEYFQNNALNARSFFDPIGPVPYLRYNNFGGSLGGPIIKNRIFFYFNVDKINNKGTYSGFATVPSAAFRQGDFSALLGAPLTHSNGSPVINPCTGEQAIAGQIYDPSTTRVVGGQTCRDPFPGNIIDTTLDPVATAMQNFYPEANLPGTQNNYQFVANSPNPFIRYTGRMDIDVTKNNRVSLTMISRDNNAFYENEFPCPVNCQHGDVSSFVAQVSDVWTISPTFVNEFRFGYNRQGNWFVPASVGLGIPQQVGLQYSKGDVLPEIHINGVGCCNGLYPSTNAIYVENSFEPSDVVTLIRGRHILHFGGELLAYQDNSTPWGNLQSGVFDFGGVYTQLPVDDALGVTGSAYADFLLGQVQGWAANNQPPAGGRQKSPQFFVQDDIKVRPNFTLNVGLRYQIQGGWSETKNQQGVFDPTIQNDLTGTLGAMWFAGETSRKQLQKNVYDIFLPRVGFAWSPKSNTTVRGGFGIYALNWSLDTYGNGMGFGSNSTGSIKDESADGLAPVATLSGDGASLPYVLASRDPTAYNGQSVNYNPYDTPVGKMYQWNLSIQRQLSHNFMAEIAYVGSHGANLSFPVDINQVPESQLAPDAPRPYPQYQSINGNTFNAISNYNALQLQIQKRASFGLSFNANYTWSHFLDDQDSSGWGGRGGTQPYQNAFDPQANYGNSNFDITHIFKANVTYELPFGKGHQFANNSKVLDAIIGGWQTSTIIIAQTGNPFTFTISGNNNSFSQAGNWYPNVVGDPHSGSQSINQWFDPSAFEIPADATFGNSGRNTFRGPGLFTVNFSLGKSFHFGERMGFEIRADASNIFNHPSFGHPNTNINEDNAGQITSTTVGGRNIQLGARFSF